ncbi:UNKNOWN [Stylonychia lemnae]|uniref:Uncharacterized protein n=1 Tax=Stylonychia lemnae TaxID=5949 RepID=A0A078A481_STYLE|nr:UNKNOWN [Stylonychia lemnae]|eukprot:CDW76699.1 UNKNOWN [Stylonychia lemnae]
MKLYKNIATIIDNLVKQFISLLNILQVRSSLCFQPKQLPLIIGNIDSDNVVITTFNYEPSNSFIAIGGSYNGQPLLGLYSLSTNYQRLVRLHTYNLENYQESLSNILESVDDIKIKDNQILDQRPASTAYIAGTYQDSNTNKYIFYGEYDLVTYNPNAKSQILNSALKEIQLGPVYREGDGIVGCISSNQKQSGSVIIGFLTSLQSSFAFYYKDLSYLNKYQYVECVGAHSQANQDYEVYLFGQTIDDKNALIIISLENNERRDIQKSEIQDLKISYEIIDTNYKLDLIQLQTVQSGVNYLMVGSIYNQNGTKKSGIILTKNADYSYQNKLDQQYSFPDIDTQDLIIGNIPVSFKNSTIQLECILSQTTCSLLLGNYNVTACSDRIFPIKFKIRYSDISQANQIDLNYFNNNSWLMASSMSYYDIQLEILNLASQNVGYHSIIIESYYEQLTFKWYFDEMTVKFMVITECDSSIQIGFDQLFKDLQYQIGSGEKLYLLKQLEYTVGKDDCKQYYIDYSLVRKYTMNSQNFINFDNTTKIVSINTDDNTLEGYYNFSINYNFQGLGEIKANEFHFKVFLYNPAP